METDSTQRVVSVCNPWEDVPDQTRDEDFVQSGTVHAWGMTDLVNILQPLRGEPEAAGSSRLLQFTWAVGSNESLYYSIGYNAASR